MRLSVPRSLAPTLALLLLAQPLCAAEDPLSVFTAHFGDEANKVRVTRDASDDAELARKIIEQAPTISADVRVQVLLYNRAYDLGIAGPEGYDQCDKALAKLMEVAPEQKASIDERALAIFERRLRASLTAEDRLPLLARYLARLDDVAASKCADKKYDEAATIYTKASPAFGTSSGNPIPDRVARVRALQVSSTRLNAAKVRLKSKPDDPIISRDLVMLYMTDFDQPAEAARYVAACNDQALTYVVTLANSDVEKFDASQLLTLGEWYRLSGEKASAAGRASSLAHSQSLLSRVADKEGATDEQRQKAASLLEQVAKLNPAVELKASAQETAAPQYIRTVAWDNNGGEGKRATARAGGLACELAWADARRARASVGYEFAFVRKLSLEFDEVKFDADEDSAVAVTIDYRTPAGYTSRAVLVLSGNPARLQLPALQTLGLQREDYAGPGDGHRRHNDGPRPGDGPRRDGPRGPGAPSNFRSGEPDTNTYEFSDDIPGAIRRGVDLRPASGAENVVKLPGQTAFQWDLKTWAPKDWDGRVWFQIVAMNPKGGNGKIRAHFEVPGFKFSKASQKGDSRGEPRGGESRGESRGE